MTDIERRIARIRRLFARLQELGWHEAGPAAPLDESAVEAFESRNGLRLPEGYRRYLLEFGDVDTGLMALAMGGVALAQQEQMDPFWQCNTGPFRLSRAWAGTTTDLREAHDQMGIDAEDLDPDDFYDIDGEPRDGVLYLGGTRSQLYAWLVLNGPFEGQVWVDSLAYAPHGWFAPAVDMMQEFVPYRWWHQLRDEPWFPAIEEFTDSPDFLDLTGDCLAQIVLRADVHHALDPDTVRAVDQRLQYSDAYDFRDLMHGAKLARQQ